MIESKAELKYYLKEDGRNYRMQIGTTFCGEWRSNSCRQGKNVREKSLMNL